MEKKVSTHPPPDSASDDIAVIAKRVTLKRFHFVKNIKNPCFKQLFQLAVNEQARKFANGIESPGRYDTSGRGYALKRPVPVPKDQLLAASNKIGTLPAIFHKMMEIINNPYSSSEDAAKIIASDPALAAKLLRLVNSAFYGLSTRVDTISRAVSIVGHGPLMMLTMGAILASSFTGIPTSIIDMRSFWMHAFSTGVTAQCLANNAGLDNSENLFIGGLLHDIARLLFFIEAPACSIYIMTESRQNTIPMVDMERDLFGVTHEELAVELLELWNCPSSIIEPISHHHKQLAESDRTEDMVLPVANCISTAMGYGSSGDFFIQDLPDCVWQRLGLTPATLAEETESVEETLNKMLFAIQPSAGC